MDHRRFAAVKKSRGERVVAGTVNGAGSLGSGDGDGRADRACRDHAPGRASTILALEGTALADRAAFWLTIAAIAAVRTTFMAWMALRDDPAFAVERLVTVLAVSCPHAFRLAVPLVITISRVGGEGRAPGPRPTRAGGCSEPHRPWCSTRREPSHEASSAWSRITTTDAVSEEDALRLAAAVERNSEHTIAHGIVRSAKERGIVPPAGRRIPSHSRRGSTCTSGWAVAGDGWPGAARVALSSSLGSVRTRHESAAETRASRHLLDPGLRRGSWGRGPGRLHRGRCRAPGVAGRRAGAPICTSRSSC